MNNDETPTVAPAAPDGAQLDLQEVFRLQDYWETILFNAGVEDCTYPARAIIAALLSNPDALPRTK